MMNERWRILILEDSPDDVNRITEELNRAGIDFLARVASSRLQFEQVLEDFVPDLVLCKFTLPGINCYDALHEVRKIHSALPFIVVSDPVGEDAATATIRQGANDFVLKGRLAGLSASVEQALHAFEDQLEREQDNALAYSRLRTMQRPQTLTREKPAVGEHIRVLVLEDEQVDLIALEHALDKIDSSITLLAVTNRNDFLRALMDFEPQIIVSDYALPGFDGISALGLRNEICPEVPFILTSGILDEEIGMEALKHGVTDYVQKGPRSRIHFAVERALSEAGARADRALAESNLKRSELMFRQLAENLGAALWIASQDLSKLFYVNRAYERIWGQSADTLYRKPLAFLDPIHPEDRRKVTTALRTATGDDIDEHVRIVRPDGDISWVWIRTFPISSSGHQLNRTCGLAQDITEWKRAQLEAKESQEKEKALLERLQLQMERMPIACILQDADFNIIYWNPVSEQIFGYTAEEVLGKHPRDLIIPPESVEFVTGKIFQRLREGDMTVNGEATNITKDGQSIKCIWYNTPLHSPDGTFNGTMSMVQDITEKAREEEALRASEANYREIFDAVNDGIFVHDLKTGAILHVNKRAEDLYGYTREELLKLDIGVVSLGESPFSLQDAEEKIRKARDEGPQVFEWLSRTRDGKLIWVEVNLYRVNLVGEDRVLAIVRNIDERKREQLLIEDSEKIKTQVIENAQNAVFAFDEHLRVKMWNPLAAELFGWTNKEALGEKISSLIVTPANRESFEELLTKFVLTQDEASQNRLAKLVAQNKNGDELACKLHAFAAKSGETTLFCVIVANTALLLKR
ncbi:MAG: PAS domain S-box protein, partial [Candidatus Melainabacteria bacterium]|nr:PAS domain S-box protein [Candidatus Melainabacteria bacterium]